MNTKQHTSKNVHLSTNRREGRFQSSHYYRTAQPDNQNVLVDAIEERPSKEKIIDVFEFEPVGFMSHGRW